MTPDYADDWLTVYAGDCREVLATLPDACVDCVVTSPPYWMQRSYLAAEHELKASEIGQEPTFAEWVETIVAVCAELGRVLKPEGSLWLNVGDRYCAYQGEHPNGHATDWDAKLRHHPPRRTAKLGFPDGVRQKSLLLAPYRLAIALQDAGWIVRDEVIWAKANPLPESVGDRLARRHEVLFRLTKQERAYFDLDAIREPYSPASIERTRAGRAPTFSGKKGAPPGVTHRSERPWTVPKGYDLEGIAPETNATGPKQEQARIYAEGGRLLVSHGRQPLAERLNGQRGMRGDLHDRPGEHADERVDRAAGVYRYASRLRRLDGSNPGNVWRISTAAREGARFNHFAMFPGELVVRPILATCPKGGVVLDPFAGTGTTAEVANALLRRAVLIELDPASLDAIRIRTSKRPIAAVPA